MHPAFAFGFVRAALRKLTLAMAAMSMMDAARRKKNAPVTLLADRTFGAARCGEELKTVYLVRHGESQWNEAQAKRDPVGMFGKFDHALTAGGVAQAEALAERIRKAPRFGGERAAFERATVVYCSPLTRAIQTALVALRRHPCLKPRGPGRGVVLVPACRELCYPVGGFDSLVGASGAALLERVVRRARAVAAEDALGAVVAGAVRVDASETEASWWGPERRRGVSDRLQAFVDRLAAAEDGVIIVVGHSLFFKTLLHNFASPAAKKGDPTLARLGRKKLANAAVARVTLNCSDARFPITAAELVFPEEDDDDGGEGG